MVFIIMTRKNIQGLSIKTSYNNCSIEVSLTVGKDYRDIKTSLVKRKY